MSALNIFLQDGPAAHLVTDGAAEQDGKIVATVNKAFTVPHLCLAGAIRGTTKDIGAIQLLVGRFETVNAMRQELERDIRGAHHDGIIGDFDLAVVGIDGDTPFGFLISSQRHPGTTPFKFIPVTGGIVTPLLDVALLSGLVNRYGDDIDNLALAVISAQREKQMPRVGSFAQVTSVTADGICQRIVGRWPEDIELS